MLAAALAFAAPAFAQAPAKPRIYALVSAIGSEVSYVRQVKGTGSHIPPYRRFPLQVPDGALDAAVLRGLDRAIAQEDPDSVRIFLRTQPGALTGLANSQRGDIIAGRVMDDLKFAADRKDWDRIILVTPRFANVGWSNMGDKLQGIGVYVQPLGRGLDGWVDDELHSSSDPETFSPGGKRSTSYRFVAPYFYAQIWIIDAKTMQVLEKKDRYDFIRLYDPESNTIDIKDNIPPEKLADRLTVFVERASSKAFREAVGEVTVREPRIVSPATK
jgi:hypothetical protein